jgi:carbon storage regulator
MLVLTRKSGEAIRIGDDIKVVVLEFKENQIKLGIEAPHELPVHREEVYLKIQEDNIRAAGLPAEIAETLKGIKKK